jgi:hypothetical protein
MHLSMEKLAESWYFNKNFSTQSRKLTTNFRLRVKSLNIKLDLIFFVRLGFNVCSV